MSSSQNAAVPNQPQPSEIHSATQAPSAKVHSVEAASGEMLSVELLSKDGIRSNKGAPEEWFAALDHFRSKKTLENQNDTLANTVAKVASMWAIRRAWVKSVFVLLDNANDANSVLTLLISVDDSKAENSWVCSQFAMQVGGHSGHAVQTCVIEEDVEPQAGYIHSYIRSNAKS
jgi:hypothetical protein